MFSSSEGIQPLSLPVDQGCSVTVLAVVMYFSCLPEYSFRVMALTKLTIWWIRCLGGCRLLHEKRIPYTTLGFPSTQCLNSHVVSGHPEVPLRVSVRLRKASTSSAKNRSVLHWWSGRGCGTLYFEFYASTSPFKECQ